MASKNVAPLQVLKRKHDGLDSTMCLFCHSDKKEVLRVGSAAGKDRILQVCNERRKLRDTDTLTVINSVSDLAGTPVWTTEELKWHKSCYSTFTSVIALDRLRKRFNLSASTSGASGSKTDTNQPRPHRQTLQANFQLCIFCQSSNTSGMPLSKKASLLMYPSNRSEYVIAKHLGASCSSESTSSSDESSPDLSVQESGELHELIHTALKIRMDLDDTPGHSAAWHGIDQEHVEKVIPNSLYVFLSVLLGGVNTLEGVDEGPDRTSICSLAQDIVYTASNKRKLTPKQIGLGLTLHQATRSATLVDLFHSAGHTVGMDTIRRLDTTIATKILDKYEQNGNVYIPNDIVQSAKGQMVLASCDNIDVLDETIDGKNTFHSTQMMLWQRVPPPESSSASDQVIGRQKALNPSVLKSLHKLDRATPFSGTRPKPRLDGPAIEIDTWFQSSEERNEAGSKNLAWILSRLHDVDNQHVPSWSSFNEASSTKDPPLTVAGMMPIIQAPADDNDTMTTVINRFKKIADHLGQKHTVIVVDQPLYSRAKELIWASPDALSDVVMLLGDLHICFNFLKVIGKHVESAGLDDAWVEAGLFAQNSTEAMMDGKAYYRAVRGHTLAYEALWRIKWEKFQEWLVLNNHNLDLDEEISRVAILFNRKETGYSSDITDAVYGLSSILRNGRVRHLLDAFDKELSQQPNFKFWST